MSRDRPVLMKTAIKKSKRNTRIKKKTSDAEKFEEQIMEDNFRSLEHVKNDVLPIAQVALLTKKRKPTIL